MPLAMSWHPVLPRVFMEAYIPELMLLIATIALLGFVLHQRWFDRHPWPGSTREELDRMLQRNHNELERKRRADEKRRSVDDPSKAKKKLAAARTNLRKVIQVRAASIKHAQTERTEPSAPSTPNSPEP